MSQSIQTDGQPASESIDANPLLAFAFAAIAVTAALGSLWLAITSNYGGHHDIYLMLGSFLSVLHDGIYIPSRFTGYPVAEIGMGASAWAGGSALSNGVNFSLFLISVLLFPFCFTTKPTITRYLAFAAMAFSSTVLAFDNIMSIDYPWSVFFWVVGCVCLKRFNMPQIAIIPMALAIGSRPVFALFVIASIMLIQPRNGGEPVSATASKQVKSKFATLFSTLFAGALFYLPVWFKNGFGLGWISAVPPGNQGLVGLIGRFVFKLIMAAGVVQSGIIFVVVILLVHAKLNNKFITRLFRDDIRFIFVITLINLAIFARMPVQLSYLQPLLLCFYYLLSQLNGMIYMVTSILIAGFNMVNWFVQPRLLRVQYQNKEICSKTVAESASFELWLDRGRIEEFKDQSNKAVCYQNWFGQIKQADYSSTILEGKPLRQALPKN